MTANNFMRTVPFVIAVSFVMISQMHVSPKGLLLALISGSVVSGRAM